MPVVVILAGSNKYLYSFELLVQTICHTQVEKNVYWDVKQKIKRDLIRTLLN